MDELDMEDARAKREELDGGLDDDSDNSFEPDEEMDMEDPDGNMWLIKVPQFLMEKWRAIQEPDVHLGTLRVYNNPRVGRAPDKFELRLPQKTSSYEYDIESIPKRYTMKMTNQHVQNQYAVTQQMKDRERNIISTTLKGKIQHECTLEPFLDDNYESLIAARHREANISKRGIVRMEEDAEGGSGEVNMLASGAAQPVESFSRFVKSKPRATAGPQFERAARMPRNELMDLLFELFEESAIWTVKDLRARTKQPEAFLRDVLSEIATLSKTGANTNTWSLQEHFKDKDVPRPIAKQEDEVFGDQGVDDDDDDLDMEEVLS